MNRFRSSIILTLVVTLLSSCSIFEPRIDVVSTSELHNQLTPAMREAMADLSSPTMTAALHRIQGDLDEVKK